MPASITKMETFGFSASRPATTLPAVPPPTTMKSNSCIFGVSMEPILLLFVIFFTVSNYVVTLAKSAVDEAGMRMKMDELLGD
jgi:ABC-type Na+ efflux pump permease subunit